MMRQNGKSGFSLVELLVVIGIIAVLGGVLVSQFGGGRESAKAVKCMSNMRSLAAAVQGIASGTYDSGWRYYPAAGNFEYMTLEATETQKTDGRLITRGWLGWKRLEKVSAYAADEASAFYAITNGCLWLSMKGVRSVYTCPSHAKYAQSAGVRANWSYAMNAYFGWDGARSGGKAASSVGFMRRYDSGSLSFAYSDATRRRPADRVLLFAELPGSACDGAVETPDFSTSADLKNDGVLQFQRGAEKESCFGSSSGETIGFNHKTGKRWFGNVAFADGHVGKFMVPADATQAKLLTRALCLGLETTFSGSTYTFEEE